MAARYTPKEYSKTGFGQRNVQTAAYYKKQREAAQAMQRRFPVAAAAAAAAAAVARPQINRAVRGLQLGQGEFKSVDVTASLDSNTATSVALLNGIARGDEINERNGREVIMKSVQLNLQIFATAVTGVGSVCRVLLVYDRQTNAAALTAALVLQAATTLAGRSLENRRRFKIMMDRTYAVPSRIAATVSGPEFIVDKFYRRLRHPITFNAGDAGTVADITTGSLYLICIGTEAAGATDGAINLFSRVRYQDL